MVEQSRGRSVGIRHRAASIGASRACPPGLVLGLILAAGLLAPASAQALDDTLAEAREKLERRDAQAAYRQLVALEDEHAGTLEYDYWLGVAALQADRPDQAILALERALLTHPEHAGARMEMAAAHLRLGQLTQAERELDRAAAQDPPPEARRAIRRYREAIAERRERQDGRRHQARLSLELGVDSNAQRFPSNFLIDPNQLIPDNLASLFEEAEVVEVSRTESVFQQYGAGYQGRIPLADDHRLEVDAAAQSRHYLEDEAHPYNLSAVQGRLGWGHDLDPERALSLYVTGLGAWNDTDFDHLLTRWGLGADFSHPVGEQSRLRWRTLWHDNRFDRTPRSNYRAGSLDLALRTPLDGWTWLTRATVEREWAASDGPATDPTRDGGDLDHWRLGIGAELPMGARQLWRIGLDRRWRRYDEAGFAIYNDFEDGKRRDESWEASLDWHYRLTARWLLQASAQYEWRDSSLAFFSTERFQTRFGIHYLF
jgi:tetratricopeptide (TPR) repeat protein